MRHLTGLLCVLYFFYYLGGAKCMMDYDFHFERWENLEGDKGGLVDFKNMRVRRIGLDFFITGNFSFLTDIDNSYQTGLTTFLSPSGNSQFYKYVLEVPPTPTCVFFNTTYKRIIEPGMIGQSNFPIIPPEGLCPIPKGTYTADRVHLDKTNLPHHMNTGFFKVVITFYKGKTSYGGFILYIVIKEKH